MVGMRMDGTSNGVARSSTIAAIGFQHCFSGKAGCKYGPIFFQAIFQGNRGWMRSGGAPRSLTRADSVAADAVNPGVTSQIKRIGGIRKIKHFKYMAKVNTPISKIESNQSNTF